MRIIFNLSTDYESHPNDITDQIVSEISSAQFNLSNKKIYFYAEKMDYVTERSLTECESNFILKNLYEKGHCNLTKHFEGINLVVSY